MDWAGASVGLGGLSVAALTLFLAYRERTKWYRERLYDKQLEAFLAICRAAGKVQSSIYLAIVSTTVARRREADPEPEPWLAVQSAHHALKWLQYDWALILPKATSEALAEYSSHVSKVTGLRWADPDFPGPPDLHASDPAIKKLEACHRDLLRALRSDLHTDQLSAETVRLIGDSQDR